MGGTHACHSASSAIVLINIRLSLCFVVGVIFAEKEASEEDEGSSVVSKVGVAAAEPPVAAAEPPVPSTKKPRMISLPDDQTAMQVECGTFHTGIP